MKIRIGFVVGSLVVVGWVGGGWADEQPQGSETTPPPSEEQAAPSSAEPPAAETLQMREPAAPPEPAAAAAEQTPGNLSAMVSVDFKEADIRQVLRVLSLKSGVDIVAGSDVDGVVSIK